MDRKEYFKEYNRNRPPVPRSNAKERNEDMKARRAADPEKYRKIARESYQRNKHKYRLSPEQNLFKGAQQRARVKNLAFDLTLTDINIPEDCPCCHQIMQSPSLDQIKAGEGYTRNNIAVICHECNTIKSHGTAERHRQIADWMDSIS